MQDRMWLLHVVLGHRPMDHHFHVSHAVFGRVDTENGAGKSSCSQAKEFVTNCHISNATNCIRCKINYRPTSVLVDTRCVCTCMSLDFANKLHLRLRPVGPGEYSHVFSANSSSTKVLGKVDASVNIDELIVPYTFLVLEHLVHSVMFGIDILKFLQAKIDLHNIVITFADDLVCLPITKSSSNIVTATAVNTVVTPPCCEVVIPVRASKKNSRRSCDAWTRPELQRKNLLSARVTVNVHNNAMTVSRLLNPTSRSQRVKKGEVVATLSTVEVLPQTDKCAYSIPSTANAVSPYVPFSHVEQQLTNLGLEFEKSPMSEAEYRDLCNLLYTNKDIFLRLILRNYLARQL